MITERGACVIGGSGTLGQEVIDRLGQRGIARILATYRSGKPANSSKAEWCRFDSVSAADDLLKIRDCILHWDTPLNYLLFLVGEASSKQTIEGTPRSEWLKLYESNVVSFTDSYTALSSQLRCAKSRVLVVSSNAPRTMKPRSGPYSATKAALEVVAVTLAREEAEFGVRVNILAPGSFQSRLAEHVLRLKGVDDIQAYWESQPWGRAMTASEVAEAAVSLLCDDAWGYCTGRIFQMSGA